MELRKLVWRQYNLGGEIDFEYWFYMQANTK